MDCLLQCLVLKKLLISLFKVRNFLSNFKFKPVFIAINVGYKLKYVNYAQTLACEFLHHCYSMFAIVS